MSRGVQAVLADLARIYDALQTHDGLTIGELSDRLGIPESTMYRHLAYLRTFWGDDCLDVRDGVYSLSHQAPRMIRVGNDDMRVLTIAQQLLDQVGLPNGPAINRIFDQLCGGDTERGHARREVLRQEAERHIAFSEPVLCRPNQDDSLISQLYACCIERPQRRVRFHYESRTSAAQPERNVVPLGLIFNGAWYLVGYDEHREPRERVYAMDRISRLRQDPFGANPAAVDFDLQGLVKTAWRLIVSDRTPKKVVIRMPLAHAAPRLHHSQVVEDVTDGHARTAFYVAAPDEMIPFILSLGPDAEVLEPSDLRDAVRRRSVEIAARYDKN